MHLAPSKHRSFAQKIALVITTSALWITPVMAAQAPQAAQPQSQNNNLFNDAAAEALRRDIQGGMKLAIAQNLKLTPEESVRFWPVYDQYAIDALKVKEAQKNLIAEYLAKFGSYDDKAASDFVRRWLENDVEFAKFRANSVNRFEKVLPPLKAASFFQLTRGLTMLIDLQIIGQLPLFQDQDQVQRPSAK